MHGARCKSLSEFGPTGATLPVQALFTTFQFHFPITVALAQMVATVPVCYLIAKPRLEWSTAKAVFPLAVVNILNVVFGLIGRDWSYENRHAVQQTNVAVATSERIWSR